VALRRRSTGGEGELTPYVFRIRFWRDWKADALAASAAWLRATVMSTMLPEAMLLGRRTEGNSICPSVKGVPG
jgi:hypothetical protein